MKWAKIGSQKNHGWGWRKEQKRKVEIWRITEEGIAWDIASKTR